MKKGDRLVELGLVSLWTALSRSNSCRYFARSPIAFFFSLSLLLMLVSSSPVCVIVLFWSIGLLFYLLLFKSCILIAFDGDALGMDGDNWLALA